MSDNGINQCSLDLLKFHLESVEAGGPEMVEDDDYEMVGENDASWQVSLSSLCGKAKSHIEWLEQQLTAERERSDSLAAHVERLHTLWLEADEQENGSPDQHALFGEIFEAIRDHYNGHTASLTQRDARVAAEVVKQIAEGFKEAWPEHTGKYHWIIGAGHEIAAGGGHES